MPTRISEGGPSLLHQLNQMLVASINADTPERVKVERQKSISRHKCVLVIQLCPALCFPWTVTCKAPLSMEFSREEDWNGLPFPSPGGLLDSGIKLRSPVFRTDSLPTEPPGKLKKKKS